MDMTFEVKGLDEVNRALAELPYRIARKILRKGVAGGASLLRSEIRRNTPIRSQGGSKKTKKGERRGPGFLKRHIGYRYLRKRSNRFEVHYSVGPRGQGFYGFFVEEGHAAGKRKKYGRGITKATGLKMVTGHPFIVPSFNRMAAPIVERMKDKMVEGILKEGQKLGFSARL